MAISVDHESSALYCMIFSDAHVPGNLGYNDAADVK